MSDLYPLLAGALLGLAVLFGAYISSIFLVYGSVRWHPTPKLTRQLETAHLSPILDSLLSFDRGLYASVEMGFANHRDLNQWYPIFSPGYRAIVARRKQLMKERES